MKYRSSEVVAAISPINHKKPPIPRKCYKKFDICSFSKKDFTNEHRITQSSAHVLFVAT